MWLRRMTDAAMSEAQAHATGSAIIAVINDHILPHFIPGTLVTIIARHPEMDDVGMILSKDDLGQVIQALMDKLQVFDGGTTQ